MRNLESYLDEVPETEGAINIYLKLAAKEFKTNNDKNKRLGKLIDRCQEKLKKIKEG